MGEGTTPQADRRFGIGQGRVERLPIIAGHTGPVPPRPQGRTGEYILF